MWCDANFYIFICDVRVGSQDCKLYHPNLNFYRHRWRRQILLRKALLHPLRLDTMYSPEVLYRVRGGKMKYRPFYATIKLNSCTRQLNWATRFERTNWTMTTITTLCWNQVGCYLFVLWKKQKHTVNPKILFHEQVFSTFLPHLPFEVFTFACKVLLLLLPFLLLLLFFSL